MKRADLPPVTKSELIADFRDIGLQISDTVMLHASVKAIGWIVGGPDMVISAILNVIGSEGTLMMLTSWEESTYHLSDWSEESRRAYMEACPPFEPKTSRARTREMGVLPEYLRTWPNAYRSSHPDASVAAIGANAEWLTHDHPLNYGIGTGSPFEKLCQLNGKVLSVGAPLENLTVLHYAEYLASIQNKRVVKYKAPLLYEGQRVWVDIEDFDSSEGIVPWEGEDYFAIIGRDAVKSGLAKQGNIGQADSYLFPAQGLVDHAVHWLERTFPNQSRPGSSSF